MNYECAFGSMEKFVPSRPVKFDFDPYGYITLIARYSRRLVQVVLNIHLTSTYGLRLRALSYPFSC